MSNQQHLPVLGAIYTIMGVLSLAVGVALFAAIGAESARFANSGTVMDAMTSDVRFGVAFGSLLAGVLDSIGGIGLLKRKSWSWGLELYLGSLNEKEFEKE